MKDLTTAQRKALERLWFIYGNGGPRHTHGNHKFIQGILERGDDDRKFFRRPNRVPGWEPVTRECEAEVDKIL